MHFTRRCPHTIQLNRNLKFMWQKCELKWVLLKKPTKRFQNSNSLPPKLQLSAPCSKTENNREPQLLSNFSIRWSRRKEWLMTILAREQPPRKSTSPKKNLPTIWLHKMQTHSQQVNT